MLKKLLFPILVLIISAMVSISIAGTSSVEVYITQSSDTGSGMAGYRLYLSDTSGGYTIGEGNEAAWVPHIDGIPEILYILTGVADGTKYLVATAVDNAGNESGISNEVSFTADATSPDVPSCRIGNIFKD